jgi:hypothetical protein
MSIASRDRVAALIAACSFAACSGPSVAVPPQPAQQAPMQFVLPDLKPLPSCKGQSNTTDYASGPAQPLSTKGGVLCVPRFGGWGGSMSYPGTTSAGYTMSLIGSTTAYSGPIWPANEPGTAIFYIQVTASTAGISFVSKIPSGGDLASKKLKANKPYTVNATLIAFGSQFEGLGECYVKARQGPYGPYLTGLAAALAGHGFSGAGTRAVIEVIPGKFASKKC